MLVVSCDRCGGSVAAAVVDGGIAFVLELFGRHAGSESVAHGAMQFLERAIQFGADVDSLCELGAVRMVVRAMAAFPTALKLQVRDLVVVVVVLVYCTYLPCACWYVCVCMFASVASLAVRMCVRACARASISVQLCVRCHRSVAPVAADGGHGGVHLPRWRHSGGRRDGQLRHHGSPRQQLLREQRI
jgi:hypothetical protein